MPATGRAARLEGKREIQSGWLLEMPGHNKARASRGAEASSAWARAALHREMQTDETGLNWTEGKLGHQGTKSSRTGLLTPQH